ncbi:MAG: NPCBM/NEW2 domain-containing protein [Fimbriimonadales bacterium]
MNLPVVVVAPVLVAGSIWGPNGPLPTKVSFANGVTTLVSGGKSVKIVTTVGRNGETYSVRPAQNITISFLMPGTARPKRFLEGRSVHLFQIGSQPIEDANAFGFGGVDYLLQGAQSVVRPKFVRVDFRKSSPSVTILRRAAPVASSIGLGGDTGQFIESVVGKLRSSSAGFGYTGQKWAKLAALLTRVFALPDVSSAEVDWRDGLPDSIAVRFGSESAPGAVVIAMNLTAFPRSLALDFGELGLDTGRTYTVFEPAAAKLFPGVATRYFVQVEAESYRTFVLRPTVETPVLLGSAEDELFGVSGGLQSKWDAKTLSLSGRNVVEANATESVFVTTSAPGFEYVKPKVEVNGKVADAVVSRGTLFFALTGNASGVAEWKVTYGGKVAGKSPSAERLALAFSATGNAGISRLEIRPDVAGYMVVRNDQYLGCFGDAFFADRGMPQGSVWSYSVTPISVGGIPGRASAFIKEAPPFSDLALANLVPTAVLPFRLPFVRDRSGAWDGKPILISNKPRAGIGVMTGLTYKFDLRRGYRSVGGEVGVEDRHSGEVQFEILADGVSVFKSKKLKAGETERFDADVTGRVELTLKTNGGEGPAVWINPRLLAMPHLPATLALNQRAARRP